MAKVIKGVHPRRKDERKYGRAIDEQIIRPILSEILIDLETAPDVAQAWRDVIQRKILEIQSSPDLGEDLAREQIDLLRHYHKEKMIASFESAIGVNVNPFLSDLNIRPDMIKALKTNVDLITNIPQKTLNDILGDFDKIFQEKGFDQQSMVEALNNRFKMSKRRASFIAEDQTQKIIGELSRVRQKNLGINSYIWQTMEDLVVVGTPGGKYPVGTPGHMNHYVRNGVEFLWDATPPDGHPGQAFNCRCVALAVVR